MKETLETILARTDRNPREKAADIFASDFAELMKLPEFRRWLLYVIDDSTFCAIATDPASPENTNQTFFDLGRQRIGKLLFKRSMEASAPMHLRMTAETIQLRERLSPAKP